MIRLSIPGILMVLSEWLAFELLTLSAAYLSTAHLAAQSILNTIAVLMYHFPFPASVAATTRFGNLIGQGALGAARVAARTYAVIFIGIGIFDFALIVSLRNLIPIAFSKDSEVQALVTQVIPVVAGLQFFDSTTALANGLVRGLGRQVIGGSLNFAVYYTFAVPFALFLSFGPPKLDLAGLWIGPFSGIAALSFIEGAFVKWSSWQRAVDDARSREERIDFVSGND